jgi:signal transduction histidine kinase
VLERNWGERDGQQPDCAWREAEIIRFTGKQDKARTAGAIPLAFVLLYVVLAGIALISYQSTRTLIEMNEWVSHTTAVIARLHFVASTLSDIENVQRTYLITDDDKYARQFRDYIANFNETLVKLKEDLADSPMQTSRLDAVIAHSRNEINVLNSAMQDYRKDPGVTPDKYLSKGRVHMEASRVILDKMLDEEQFLLGQRQQAVSGSANLATTTTIVLSLLLFVTGGALAAMVKDHFEQRRVAEEATRKSEEQREDFIAALAHDLKIPVLGEARILELLLKGALGPLTDEQSKLMKQLKSNNESQLNMIKRLLDVYRLESSPLAESNGSIVDLVKNAQKCVQEFAGTAQQKGISLIQELPSTTVLIRSDAESVQSLMRNLIDNAMKFTTNGGKVIVSILANTQEAQLVVQDSGQGIPENSKEYLFDRFWQGPPGKHSAGIGLGLYICKRIVENLGGKIDCRSTVGVGTTFTVSLPVAEVDTNVSTHAEIS